MKLVEPTMEYERQIEEFRQEFLLCEGSMDGSGSLRRAETVKDWINENELLKKEETLPEGKVCSTQRLYYDEEKDKVVGVIQIRHYFNDYLEKYGGHIGYSVCPSERQKGYASRMLEEALPICRDIGLNKVLLTCLHDNLASAKVIRKNGGIYESTVYEPKESVYLDRYWIEI